MEKLYLERKAYLTGNGGVTITIPKIMANKLKVSGDDKILFEYNDDGNEKKIIIKVIENDKSN